MAKKSTKKFLPDGTMNQKFWEELKYKTLIQSTASSLRLSGINITEKEVEQIINRSASNQALDKLLRLKKIERLGLGRSTRYRKI